MNIIITGASRGIGFEMVKHLVSEGDHKILAVSRNYKSLLTLEGHCKSINEKATVVPLALDLTNNDFEEKLIDTVEGKFEHIDILVNNAGYIINKPLIEISNKEFDKVFSVNIKAPFRLVKALFPYFSSRAHIVNISSMGGFQGSMKFPGLSVYSASKGALAIMTEAMAEEFKEQGIAVNCLALGSAQTEMIKEAFPNYEAPVTAEQMATFISYFALNGNNYFNGKTLPVAVTVP